MGWMTGENRTNGLRRAEFARTASPMGAVRVRVEREDRGVEL